MRIDSKGQYHLTYCTNIHPGESWEEVRRNLETHTLALKRRLSPNAPFGVGLRLSAKAAETLLEADHLPRFKEWLDASGLYVFTLNGYPYGSFHHEVVKAQVFAPDWRDDARLRYTLNLVTILRAVLPDGLEGGISTVPLSYRAWVREESAAGGMAVNLARVTKALVRIREEGGPLIHLDLEPEPDGLLCGSRDVVHFYKHWLFTAGAEWLAEDQATPLDKAREQLIEHVRVCFDTCHLAVEYEAPEATLERLASAGIQIGKLQISSALKVLLPEDRRARMRLAAELEPFAESTWLHQVVEERVDGRLHRYPDLREALLSMDNPFAKQWRIHFHVPLFIDQYGSFYSTGDHTRASLIELGRRRFTKHLEVETYTWEVLPPGLKLDVVDSIERELRWVREQLGGRKVKSPRPVQAAAT